MEFASENLLVHVLSLYSYIFTFIGHKPFSMHIFVLLPIRMLENTPKNIEKTELPEALM